MSRQLYGASEPVTLYRRMNRSLPHMRSEASHDNVRTLGRPSRYPSPPLDGDHDRDDVQQARRRIAVAVSSLLNAKTPSFPTSPQQPELTIIEQCARCRKRKIKCSGDVGGEGCQNCKSAGVSSGQCQFLRVNRRWCRDAVHKLIP